MIQVTGKSNIRPYYQASQLYGTDKGKIYPNNCDLSLFLTPTTENR